jgi:hypothetical protein
MLSLKTVGHSGQISIGKQFAGRHVVVEEIEKGVWMVKLGEFIPDSERWLFTSEVEKTLKEAFEWVEKNPRKETDLAKLEQKILSQASLRSP